MEQIKQLKIDLEREITSHIQTYLMGILSSHDIVYDVDGEIVNEINYSPFCKVLNFVSEHKERCRSYSRELAKSAMCYKKPFEDVCPGGLTLFALPICFGEDTVVGAHCVAISNPLRSKFSVYDIASRFGVDVHILWDAVKKTPLIQKPLLKIAREQAITITDLLSKVLSRIHTLKQNEEAIAKKYSDIEAIIKGSNVRVNSGR
ncbi:MAG TPA: PocR ligand-binding domain-containing protein [Candidatus Brocadiaceae bacterium]|nr:PocR ligand-binding domain-containing protein [Candidatus Brocadiaceae bacterium]